MGEVASVVTIEKGVVKLTDMWNFEHKHGFIYIELNFKKVSNLVLQQGHLSCRKSSHQTPEKTRDFKRRPRLLVSLHARIHTAGAWWKMMPPKVRLGFDQVELMGYNMGYRSYWDFFDVR